MTSVIQPRTATSLQWSGQYEVLAPAELLANPSTVVEVDGTGDIILQGTNGANQLLRLDGAALVPSANLPSYVDDVLTFANVAAFPVTGEIGKIYVALDTSYSYRWTGSAYFNISTHQFYSKAEIDTMLTQYCQSTETFNLNFGTIFNATLLDTFITRTQTIQNSASAVRIDLLSDMSKVTMPSGLVAASGQFGPFGTGQGGSLRVDGDFLAGSTRPAGTCSLVCSNSSFVMRQNGFDFTTNYGGMNFDSTTGFVLNTSVNQLRLDSSNLNFTSLPTGTGTALVISGSRVFVNSSNPKYKENVSPLSFNTDCIYNFTPKEYNFKGQGIRTIGYMADEIAAHCPIITTTKDGEADSVKYEAITVLLVEELRKCRATITTMQAEISALKIRVEALESTP